MEEPDTPPNVVDKGTLIPSRHSGLWFSSDEKKPADGSSKGSCTSPRISPGLPFYNVKQHHPVSCVTCGRFHPHRPALSQDEITIAELHTIRRICHLRA